MSDCIFCKIVQKEIPADVVFENEKILVFKDINPKAPVHCLVIPKKHIPSLNETKEEDKELLGELMLVARDVAKEMKIDESGYKLSVHTGEGGGQEVFHIHIHILGGWS